MNTVNTKNTKNTGNRNNTGKSKYNHISSNNDPVDTSEDKYKEISSIFEKLFIRHGLFTKDKFNETVWFIKNKNWLSNSTPHSEQIKDHPLKEILLSLNSNKDGDENGDLNIFEDFNLISIKVSKFIHKICKVLINCNKIINRSENTIKLYNAHQKVNVITENIKLLKNKIEKSNNKKFVSHFSLSLRRLEGFTKGDYNFELAITELENYRMILKVIKLEEPVKIQESITILPMTTSLTSINNNKYEFPNFEFKILNNSNNNNNDNSTTTAENTASIFSSQSVTTLSNFKIRCVNSFNTYFETNTENFLDLLLIYIEEVYDLSKESIVKTLHLKLPGVEQKQIVVDMILKFDCLTRSEVLKNIKDILNGVIDTKRVNENYIDEVLDEAFSDTAEQIKSILYSKKEVKLDTCCSNNCLIF